MSRRRLVVATRNAGKAREIEILLADIGIECVTIAQASPNFGEIAEDGDTFQANSRKKAWETALAVNGPALADDSGLEVDALRGAPGVISARYAGVGATDGSNNAKLLSDLHGVLASARTARFRCVVTLADPMGALGEDVLQATGVCEGRILEGPRGEGGFGYDPLFFSDELQATFAEAGIGPKGGVSHRARALRILRPRLLAYLSR